jgi:hypothetical protein
MCFSPEVSFGSAIVIGLIGLYGLSLVKNRRMLHLACLPLIFALQQVCEGVLWLYLRDQAVSTSFAFAAQRIYLFLAYMLYPVYLPYIAWRWESSPSRRIWIGLTLLAGVVIACVHAYLTETDTIVAQVVGSSIQYPFIWLSTGIPYLIVVSLPCFLCRDRRMWVIGALVFASFFLAWWVRYMTLASVWCFFSAWISILSVWVLRQPPVEESKGE